MSCLQQRITMLVMRCCIMGRMSHHNTKQRKRTHAHVMFTTTHRTISDAFLYTWTHHISQNNAKKTAENAIHKETMKLTNQYIQECRHALQEMHEQVKESEVSKWKSIRNLNQKINEFRLKDEESKRDEKGKKGYETVQV